MQISGKANGCFAIAVGIKINKCCREEVIMKSALNLFKGIFCGLIAAVTGAVVYYNIHLPDSYIVSKGESLQLGNFLDISSDGLLPENYSFEYPAAEDFRSVFAAGTGGADIQAENVRSEQLRLFGIFPIKTVTVSEVNEPVVIPCGTPFGIKLLTEGVMVVELTGFDSGGKISSPARDAGIEEGDIILSISGKKVTSNKEVSGIIEESGGKTLGVEIMSGGERKIVFIRPEKSAADDCYRAGMWVRDSSAGIGTVTFYDPATHIFAGLGHPVCDRDTGEALTMSKGESADVIISGIKKSSAGAPGELIGMFADNDSSGQLLANSDCGLYGRMDVCPSYESAVPVAMRQEISEGKAEIIATVSGSTPMRFAVEIEKIDLTDREDSHNMVIHVTDSRLLEKAGGIVQGMSGSPIIQNGKLVGAVTHVLVRDPTRGYGIFADTMINSARELSEARG